MSPAPKTSPSPDIFEVILDRLAYGGDALGRLPDGRAVFVPFGLAGETVRIRVVEEKRGHVRAELLEILVPAAERIPARCPHFGVCGGCHFQNLAYPEQLKAKQSILEDQLRRIGKIDRPPLRPIVASLQEWNYRNHVQFHLTEDGRLGYVGARGESVVPIMECHLPETAISELWPQLAFDPGMSLERIGLRQGYGDDLMLVLESEQTPEMELEAGLSVVHLNGEDAFVIAGEEHLVIQVAGRDFHLSAASFFQVNTSMAEKMVEHLLAILPVGPGDTLLDVYCGVGLFSAFFAPRVGRLIGIELSGSACADFALNLDEFDNVELFEAAAEQVLPSLGLHPAAAIVDPPRAGLDRQALEALAALDPQRIAYVSCDPATLARDAARLMAAGYRLEQVTPFDLFPQTYHIESISLFLKD
jgi:23S rRNA (uracil1939-C5)-methyltransferase